MPADPHFSQKSALANIMKKGQSGYGFAISASKSVFVSPKKNPDLVL